MSTTTKAGYTLQTSTNNAAGNTTTGSSLDLRTGFGMLVTAKISNGAIGPTKGCRFTLEISSDGSDWDVYSEQIAGTDNNAEYTFTVNIPGTVMYLRSQFSGNTDEAVSVEAKGQAITNVGE